MSGRIVCLPNGRQLVIKKRDGWWIAEDAHTRECLTGGFRAAAEAESAVRSESAAFSERQRRRKEQR